MYFDVMDLQYEDIRDPDTDEVLGSYRASEGQSKNYVTYKKICLWQRHTEKSDETLEKTGKLEDEPDELDECDSYVKTGDPVVQVIEKIDTKREVLTEDTEALNPAIED